LGGAAEQSIAVLSESIGPSNSEQVSKDELPLQVLRKLLHVFPDEIWEVYEWDGGLGKGKRSMVVVLSIH
jgi:hypothetical protein